MSDDLGGGPGRRRAVVLDLPGVRRPNKQVGEVDNAKWKAWGPGPDGLSIAIELEEVDGHTRVLGFTVFAGTRQVGTRHSTLGEAWDAASALVEEERVRLDASKAGTSAARER